MNTFQLPVFVIKIIGNAPLGRCLISTALIWAIWGTSPLYSACLSFLILFVQKLCAPLCISKEDFRFQNMRHCELHIKILRCRVCIRRETEQCQNGVEILNHIYAYEESQVAARSHGHGESSSPLDSLCLRPKSADGDRMSIHSCRQSWW